MRLEQELGFCSSFNFIPEGDYKVPPELRAELESNGFEVGIHDLKHDGRLFLSRRAFSRKAARINRYLRDWNVAGFRSGFMLHKLDWLHELDIQYDASTFDTDPFEPQPEGRHTIFPFWVPARGAWQPGASPAKPRSARRAPSSGTLRTGYVDSLHVTPGFHAFLIAAESTRRTSGCKNLTGLRRHGGMALVNVHPDYLCFDGATPRQDGISLHLL